jgi:hypothetical protein
MDENSSSNDDVNDNDNDGNDNDNGVVLPQQRGGKTSSSSCSTYSIEVCQGPDCTGLGGGVAELEIEELVREYEHNQHHGTNHNNRIRVIAGGCRNFCSVGPNAHILVQRQQQRNQKRGKKTRATTTMLESFQNVKDASSCNRVVNNAIAYASSSSSFDGLVNETPIASSSSPTVMNRDRHRSMVARKSERTRWEALKDVSRTIAKCKKVVDASNNGGSGSGMERKHQIWKETCTDRIHRATTPSMTMTSHQSQRDQRRSGRLIEIASEKLDRICLQSDDESDNSSYNSSSEESDTSDE